MTKRKQHIQLWLWAKVSLLLTPLLYSQHVWNWKGNIKKKEWRMCLLQSFSERGCLSYLRGWVLLQFQLWYHCWAHPWLPKMLLKVRAPWLHQVFLPAVRCMFLPHKHFVSPLPDHFAVISELSASSCPLVLVYPLETQPLVLYFSGSPWLSRWLPRPTLIPISGINPWSKDFPPPFTWPKEPKKPIKPLLHISSGIQRQYERYENSPSGPFPPSAVET